LPDLSRPSTSSLQDPMPNILTSIANDVDILLVGMSRLLSASGDIDVVDTAKNGLEAVTSARELRPDVIIIDIHTPNIA